MPSTNFSAGTFRIVIDNPQEYYSNGDVISGNVVLVAQEEQPIGEVRINLIGRAKTKICRNNGQSRRVYRGRAVFFDIPLLLHNGHFTHKADTYTWPFSFPITARAQPTLLTGDEWQNIEGYMSNQDQVSADSLPPTYRCDFTYHMSNEAFVEYKLVATLVEPDSARRFTFPRTYEAEQHFALSAQSTDYPMADPPFRTTSDNLAFRSLKLLPEYADPTQKLSFKQKTSSFFRPSKVPTLKILVHVALPQVIQLNHLDHVPILVSAEVKSFEIPSDESSSSSAAPDAKPPQGLQSTPLPEIRLTRFSLYIHAQTNYRAKSMGFFGYEPSEMHDEDLKFADKLVVNHPIPIVNGNPATAPAPNYQAGPSFMPEKGAQQIQAAETPLDLNAIHNFRFAQTPGLTARSEYQSNSGPYLTPGFRTCNIQLTHTWCLKLDVEVAGEKESIDVRGLPLEVLGRARYNSAPTNAQQTQMQPQMQAPPQVDAWPGDTWAGGVGDGSGNGNGSWNGNHGDAANWGPSPGHNGVDANASYNQADMGGNGSWNSNGNNGWESTNPDGTWGDGSGSMGKDGYSAPPMYQT